MIHSADIHDDLDVVTSVYLPESKWNSLQNIDEVITLFLASYTINHPSFDQEILNPNARILDISTNYSYVEKNKRSLLI
jgi:hypothetical protein